MKASAHGGGAAGEHAGRQQPARSNGSTLPAQGGQDARPSLVRATGQGCATEGRAGAGEACGAVSVAVKIDELPMKDQEALIKADEATQARQRDQCSNRAGFSRTATLVAEPA